MSAAFPSTVYQRGNPGDRPMEPYYTVHGMSLQAFYLAHILTGLASNPATMLNIEEHMDYAVKLSALAANRVQ
jgi:hypothetical protein